MQSEYFCNDHNRRHNQMAKTLHNLKCKRRSVANVILSHTDFISTRPRRPYVDPTFSVVRGDNRRIVLVIDTSPSMSGIIETVRQVASTFVSDFVEKSALVGLVEFNKVGRIVVPLTAVDSASNRQLLIDRIHSLSPQGMTNIADGLLQAVKVLGGDIEDAHSVLGTIILLSDGSNNHGSHYDRYIEAVINKGIVANTISYGTAADRKLTRLAEGSNGKFLFAASNDYSQLLSVFSYQDSCEAMLNMTTKIMEDEVELQWDLPSTYLTYVDRFAGTNVRIDVTVSMDVIVKKHDPIVVILLDELGNVHQPITSTTHQSRRTHAFRIPKVPVKVDVQITGMQKVSRISSTVHFVVFSGNLVGSRNILPTGKLLMSEIPLLTSLTEVPVYVDLTSCGLETGENVTVTLTMSDPTILKSSFRMTDDGLGSDSISGDQIYSTSLYAKDLKVVGFFTFSASVLIRNSDGDIVKRNVDVGCLRILAVQPQPLEDKIAPSLIDYVGVKVGDSTRRTVVLKFRASGDDGTQGEISKYKVKVNWSEDRTKEVIIVHVFKVIVSPGNMIQMKVDLSKFNVTNPFWIRVLGEDDMGNMGEWSQPTTFNWLYEDIKKKSIVEEQSLHIMVYLIDFTVVSVLWLTVFFVNLTKWSIVQHLCACTFHLVLHYCFYNCRLMHPAYVYVCSVDYWEILPFVVDMGPFSYLTVSVFVALVVILSTRLLRHRLHSRLHMLSEDQTRSPGYQSESCQNSLPDSMQ